ncbi:MAG TPA: hypothetical protein VD999_06645 [Vitreimonas sp.]|nr:hypothetical protein [Vitreimonas sp.]
MIVKNPYLTFKKEKTGYRLFLNSALELKQYSAIEMTMTVYPLSSKMGAQDFEIDPFEDYVAELSAGRRSTYQKLDHYADKVFSLILALMIASVFWWFYPGGLNSVEAVVGILGAYALGKEFWRDLDQILIALTHNWWVQWTESDYFYTRQNFGMIQRFWQLARHHRYGAFITLPQKMDYVTHSNSKTIDLAYWHRDLVHLNTPRVQLANIHFRQPAAPADHKQLLIAVKFSLIKKSLFFSKTIEMYQALDSSQLGSVNHNHLWQPAALLLRQKWSVGRLAHFSKVTTITDASLLELEQK